MISNKTNPLKDLVGTYQILHVNRNKVGKLCQSVHNYHIASCPNPVLGRLETKSIEMMSQFHFGISKGCSSSGGLLCSTLAFWHVKHLAMHFATSFFMIYHQKLFFKSWYIFVEPGWKLKLLLCASFKIASSLNLIFSCKIWSSC